MMSEVVPPTFVLVLTREEFSRFSMMLRAKAHGTASLHERDADELIRWSHVNVVPLPSGGVRVECYGRTET